MESFWKHEIENTSFGMNGERRGMIMADEILRDVRHLDGEDSKDISRDVRRLDGEDLEQVAGGLGAGQRPVVGRTYGTHVDDGGYLALRNYPSFDRSNEIGPLWNGSSVVVTQDNGGDYVTVAVNYAAHGSYGADVTGRVGYVNWHYLV